MARKSAKKKKALKKATPTSSTAKDNKQSKALEAASAKVKQASAKKTPPTGANGSKARSRSRSASKRGDGVMMTLSHDQIARRAFEIWVAKGRPMGQDEQNWREAEAQLQREHAPA